MNPNATGEKLDPPVFDICSSLQKRNLWSFCCTNVRVFFLPEDLSPEADLRSRPSMNTHNREIEKISGQAAQFIFEQYDRGQILTQPKVNLSLLRSTALKFQPQGAHQREGERGDTLPY